MPWYGDQFVYTRGYIQAIIENYYLLLEEAKHNPFGNAAVLVYDIGIALASTTLTKRQWQALELRMQDFTEFEIGAILGVTRDSARDRLRGASQKVYRILGESTPQNP